MFVFGPHFALSVGFRRRVRRGVSSSGVSRPVFQKKAGGVTAVSEAHVTHTYAVRLQVLSRMVCGHFCTARTAFLKTFLCVCWGTFGCFCGSSFGGGDGGVGGGDRMK